MSWIAAAVVGGSLVGGAISSKGSKDAANTSAQGSRDASEISLQAQRESIAEQKRQFEVSRNDFAPIRQVGINNLERFDREARLPGLTPPELINAGQASPLQQSRINLGEINNRAIGSADLQSSQFTPETFDFDVDQAINSPELQARLDQGFQALDRTAGRNRQLGAGNRLLAAQQFGQQTLSDELGNQFNRQLNTFNTNEGNRFGAFNVNEGNRIATESANIDNRFRDFSANEASRFGAFSANTAARINESQLNNQSARDTADFNERSRLNSINSINQNRLQRFGIQSDQFNDRLNRIASLAQIGQTATSKLSDLGSNFSSNVANITTSGANNRAQLAQSSADAIAAGQLGSANAFSGSLNTIGGFLGGRFKPNS